MGFFEQFPYANFQQFNLDWILQVLKRMEGALDDSFQSYITEWVKENYNKLFFDAAYDPASDTLTMALAESLASRAGGEPVSYINLAGQVLEILDKAARDEIDTLSADFRQFKNDTTEWEQGIEQEVQDISDATAKTWPFDRTVFFGDSYTQGYGLTSPSTQNWAAKFATMMGISNPQIFGGGGIGFSHTSASINYTALDYFNSIKTRITEPEKVTAFFACLGWNDKDQTPSNVKSAAALFWSSVKAYMPNAKMFFFTNPAYSVLKKQVLDAVYDAAYQAGVAAIDSHYWLLLRDDLFQSDHVHPDAEGASAIALRLMTSLRGGKPFNYAIKSVSNVSGYTFNITAINEMVHVYLSGTKSNGERATRIGNWPAEVFNGNNVNGPSLRFRQMIPLGDNQTDTGFIQWDNGNYNIYCCSMTKPGQDGGLSSGAFTANIVSPAIMLLG